MLNWLRRFMAGRYGVDRLSYAMLALSLLCMLLQNVFFLFDLLGILLLILCYARIFSRNLAKRYQENMRYLAWRNKVCRFVGQKVQFLRECRTHRHLRCPNCKQKIRVPRGRGRICITCPKCHINFIQKT